MLPIYLSIVTTTRNDKNDIKDIQRINLFVKNICLQAKKYNIITELIIVEWNPEPDLPRVEEVIEYQNISNPCQIRIISVPAHIHYRRHNSQYLNLYQMIAKNTGIRRAKGKFIIATNIDIIFSDELMHLMSKLKLDKNRLYRVERFDVPKNIPLHLEYDQLMLYCRRNIIRQYKKLSITNKNNQIEKNVHWQFNPYTMFMDLIREIFNREKIKKPLKLHTNASGDFTLISKDGWKKVRGYPELDVLSMHIDSLLCYIAFYSGLKEKIFYEPARIYHIDHEARTDGLQRYYKRSDYVRIIDKVCDYQEYLYSNRVMRMSSQQLYHWALNMRKKNTPIIFNKSDWGLSNENLRETHFP